MAASKRIARPCETCGKQVNNRMRGAKRFCSPPCAVIGMRKSPEERFWPLVDRGAPDVCWPWLGATNGVGYGKFKFKSRTSPLYAHRVAYELLVGSIPEGLTLDHLCNTPLCVNPAHLEPVTSAENTRRAVERRRQEKAVP